MKTDNAVTLLRSLKGAPLSVLVAIRLFGGPASLLQLAAATGYERTAVGQAVTSLEMMGFVERAHYRGWQLSRAAMQLPLWTPSEIGTIAPDARPALGAGSEVDRPPPAAGIRELKAVKNHFQGDEPETGDASEILKAGKNHFQGDGPETGDAPETLKAGKTRFQQNGSGAGDAPEILKAGKTRFQQNGSETGDAPEILKAVKNHFQQDAAGDPQMLKAGKNHFQQEDPERAEDSEILKAGKNHFQAPDPAAEALKAGKNRFQPAEPDDVPPDPDDADDAADNRALDDAEQDLLQDLIDLTGCPRKRAEHAVRRARGDGADTNWLHLQVLYWHAYLANGHANNIQNPGYFVARKLEEDEACPFTEIARKHSDKADTLRYRLQRITGAIT